MNRLDLLLPFAMPPQEMARDLLRELKTPALSTLLARANPLDQQRSDGFSRALPHEYWLARQCGLTVDLTADMAHDASPALAVNAMQNYHLQAKPGIWFILQPVHLHVARDHLVLTDLRQLKLSDQEARTLFDIAAPLMEESGKTLLYGDAQTWFLRADDWQTLQTSTPDAACGHNIDIWMPKGPNERDWRRLQNEIQMHWHDHAVNDEREANGLKPINSVWLWGGASSETSATQKKFEEIFTLTGSHHPFGSLAAKRIPATSASAVVQAKPQHGLLILDSLIEPALAGDWSEWLGRFLTMEAEWFAPLLDALKESRLAMLTITVSHNTALSTFAAGRSSLRKFWRKPSLARLLP